MQATQPTEEQVWTSLSLITWGAEYLRSKEIDSPRLTCELLLSSVLRCGRIELYTSFDRPLSPDELANFKNLFKRRLSREPLQYILGETEFMGLKFKVDSRVLIPRPETEVLVEQTLALARDLPRGRILDIGTGSGNIAISLANYLDGWQVDSIDVSPAALELAAENCAMHGCQGRVQFSHANIHNFMPSGEYNVIVSNPPYISKTEFADLQPEVRDFEPALATTDGGSGLTFYEIISAFGKSHILKDGWVLVEHAYNQSEAVREIFRNNGYRSVTPVLDYSRVPRVVKAQR